MKKTKWFIYTVIVGLVPFLARLCIFLVAVEKNCSFLINPTDFITLGLVLNITNINELESYITNNEKWKTRSIGFSVIFIIFYAIFLAISAFNEIKSGLIDMNSVKIVSVLFSLSSCFFGFSVFNRLSKMEDKAC